MTFFKRFIAFGCAVAAMALALPGCGKSAYPISQYYTPSVSSSSEDWYAADDTVVLENDRVSFALDITTTHFSVTDKRSGKVYYSVPQDAGDMISDEWIARMNSEITVCYYEEQSYAQYFYSDTDSVANGSFTILTNGDAVRVSYTLGEAGVFVPTVLDAASFNAILERLGNDALRRRLERYYLLYSAEEKPDDYDEMLAQYPALEKTELYILDSMLSDVDRADIAGYLKDAGYTSEEYMAMMNALGMEPEDQDKSAGFTVVVEYALTEDGFTAEILADQIVENDAAFKLQTIDCLEYFAATTSAEGAFFVPDGSGALVNFGGGEKGFSAPYYGDDFALRAESKTLLGKNLTLPVFGASLSDGGFFATIDSAAEIATLNTVPLSDSSAMNHIYASFAMRSIDVTDYGATMSIPVYNLFAKETVKTSPKIRYTLLAADANGYADMAAYYRARLIADGVLTDTVTAAPVYLDFLCMITENATVMGIPYTKKTVLSTIGEIKDVIITLTDAGVGPCVVRLIGYGPAGYEHKAYTRYELDKKVGTTEELKDLQAYLRSHGGTLYLDADMQFAYRGGNGFSTKDSARYLNRLVVCRGAYDPVMMKYRSNFLLRYLISPILYPEYTARMRQSLQDTFGDDLPGVAYGSTGGILGGDYTQNNNMNRAQSLSAVCAALKGTRDAGFSAMTDVGNAYVLPYVDHLTNVATVSTGYDAEDDSVPFYEMVIHGSISYAGTAQNLANDQTTARLDAVSMGAAPYMALITREDTLIANTVYEWQWYSLNADDQLTMLTAYAAETMAIRQRVSGAAMISREVSGDIAVTTYSDGTKVYVNYGYTEQMRDGITVPAQGFAQGG